MSNTLLSFILTFLAGLSTMIGTIPIFLKKTNPNRIIVSSLSFAAGVMITVSITDLIPESISLLRYNMSDSKIIILVLLSIILGIIISMLIDYYLPSNTKNNKLYKVGIISMSAIILHNIPEGIITFTASKSNINLGITLAIAIAMHNIPEGISISMPIYYSSKSKKKALWYTFISATSEPLGALIALLFLYKIINDIILGLLLSLVAGIMLQIALCELLPVAKKYNLNKYLYLFFVIGIVFMLLKFIV